MKTVTIKELQLSTQPEPESQIGEIANEDKMNKIVNILQSDFANAFWEGKIIDRKKA
ncbi:unnamed protein product, partial [marine sediment metagenome]